MFNQAFLSSFLGDDPKPPVKPVVPVAIPLAGGGDTPMAKEMRLLSSRKMAFDNLPASVVAKNAATQVGINPAFLYSSAFQEGMNKAIADPDDVSEAYVNAKIGNDYPVDGFRNYGLDTFGTKYADLVKKGYLPADFASHFKAYPAKNEAENVTTAAFKTNQDALMAKAAMLRDTMDTVKEKAKAKGQDLDEAGLNYLTLAYYNGRRPSADKLMEEYLNAKDKKAFIEKGLTSMKGIHKNIFPRIANMKIAQELLGN